MEYDDVSQSLYRCRFGWGRDAAQSAGERGDIVVIVDTLRFSTVVVTVVSRGGIAFPCATPDDVFDAARTVIALGHGADLSLPYKPDRLSPGAYEALAPGTCVGLLSPNGATCTLRAAAAPYVFVGALINAEAMAETASTLMTREGLAITVIACGERRRSQGEDGALRMAIEDFLGAGAILSYLSETKSPEARVCAAAFEASVDHLDELLWNSASGWELREKGMAEDVTASSQLSEIRSVPVLRGDRLDRFRGD